MQEFTNLAYSVGVVIAYLATIGVVLAVILALLNRFDLYWVVRGHHLGIGFAGWCILWGIGALSDGLHDSERPGNSRGAILFGGIGWLVISYQAHKHDELCDAQLEKFETECERQRILLRYIPEQFVTRARECDEYIAAEKTATSAPQRWGYLEYKSKQN